MDPSRIAEWLKCKNPNYQEGVQLYEQFGRNINLKRLFKRPENNRNLKKLQYELGKLASSLKLAKPRVKLIRVIDNEYQPLETIEEPTREVILEVDHTNRVDRMDLQTKLHKEVRELDVSRSRLSNYFHELIDQVAPVSEFKSNYDSIDELRKQIVSKRKEIKYVEKFGKLPTENQPADIKDSYEYLKLYRDKNTILTKKDHLTRALKNLTKLTEGSANRTHKEVELAKVVAAFEYIKKQMNELVTNG